MKKSLSTTGIAWVGLGMVCGLMTAGGGLNARAQAPSTEKAASSSVSTGVSVSSANGQAVVKLNGKEVYSGPAKGKVSSRSSNVDGVEYCAVYDGDTVVWENVPGAAQHLESAATGATGQQGAAGKSSQSSGSSWSMGSSSTSSGSSQGGGQTSSRSSSASTNSAPSSGQ
jgi:hypothetical protein